MLAAAEPGVVTCWTMTRRAVVSGGGTGIGRAIARRLAADRNGVVVLGRRNEVLQAAAKDINSEIGESRVTTATVDLTVPDDVRRCADELGPVDIIVNNVGGAMGSGEDTAASWEADFRGNVLTAVLLTEALLPRLPRPGGRIIAIGSIAGLRGAGAYGAAKAALHNWTLDLATKLAPEGITANVVAPGFVPDTEFWAGRLTDDLVASRLAQIPMGRPGSPEEVAAAVAYLATPDAGWTTGQILQVNGGAMLGRG